jgi:hypothetical protein
MRTVGGSKMEYRLKSTFGSTVAMCATPTGIHVERQGVGRPQTVQFTGPSHGWLLSPAAVTLLCKLCSIGYYVLHAQNMCTICTYCNINISWINISFIIITLYCIVSNHTLDQYCNTVMYCNIYGRGYHVQYIENQPTTSL